MYVLQLSIDARTQRLTGITLSDPCALPVTYGGVLLAADAIRPPFNSVYEVMDNLCFDG